MRKPTAVHTATLAVVLALVVSTSGGSSSGSAAALQTSTTPSGRTAERGGGQPSAAAWCAMAIDINTRGGTMANKQYLQSGLADPAKLKAVSQEAVNRRKEFLAITPPEIKDAMTHELDYFAAALKDPAAGMGNFTLADVRALGTFQKTKCGIGGL